jgi:flavin reductase (DIM6/NTAB) family NADH-FMN oxidoreductase RutF
VVWRVLWLQQHHLAYMGVCGSGGGGNTTNQCPPEVDEMSMSGLTPIASTQIKPPRVGESAVQFECVLASATDMLNDEGTVTGTMFIGKVTFFVFLLVCCFVGLSVLLLLPLLLYAAADTSA